MDIFKNNIDFNSYKTFYVVAKCKSFSKASEELNISQPAVSIAIKKMEDNLDVTLFKRDKKGIELTETGKQLLFYVESIINTLNTAEKRLKEDKTLTNGEVIIRMFPTEIDDDKKEILGVGMFTTKNNPNDIKVNIRDLFEVIPDNVTEEDFLNNDENSSQE